MPAELLYDTKAYLGEGPVWDSQSQTLYWLDIINKRIFANADLLLQLDDVAGCFAQRKDGGFILALTADEGQRFSFAGLELDSDKLALISALEKNCPATVSTMANVTHAVVSSPAQWTWPKQMRLARYIYLMEDRSQNY